MHLWRRTKARLEGVAVGANGKMPKSADIASGEVPQLGQVGSDFDETQDYCRLEVYLKGGVIFFYVLWLSLLG